jgi:hypothetical protein
MKYPTLALALVLAATGCDSRIVAPRQPSGLGSNPPTVATCAGTPCWCAEPATAYERCGSGVSNFPTGYPGNGSRVVTVPTNSPGVVRCWPATICGDHMADNEECPCIEDRYVVTEMLARMLSVWPEARVTVSAAFSASSTDTAVATVRFSNMPPWLVTIYSGPATASYLATFNLRPGLDYHFMQPGIVVPPRRWYLPADADTLMEVQ